MKVARSRSGMVVAAHPLAAEAGREILAESGNAVEAAVAVALTLGVVEPQASGLGGGAMMMIAPQGDPKATVFLDGRGRTSSLHAEDYVYPKRVMLPWVPKTGPMSATIPGLGRLLGTALQRYGGKTPLPRLVRRAMQAAADGFPVGEVLIYCSSLFEGTIRHYPEAAKIFYNTGRRFEPGERLVQKDLARTLRLIAERGFEVLYTGEVGIYMTQAVNATGPVWGKEDLAKYEVKIREPLWGEVAGHRIATAPPPSRGGAGILRALESLNSAPSDPAERIAFFLREIERIFRALDPIIGDPDVMTVDLARVASGEPHAPGAGTSHFTIVDREGTVVTMSQTIGHFFGSGLVVPGYGILLNDDISDMERKPGHPNSVGPSKRPVANMSPTIVFKGRPRIALGTPGTVRIFPAMTCVLSNMLHLGMDLESAVAGGRVHWEDGRAFLEGDIPAEVRSRVRVLYGGALDERRARDLFFGGVHAVEITEDGTIVGVADPRRDGVALGS